MTSSSSIEEKSKREEIGCFHAHRWREMKLKRKCRERRNHTRESLLLSPLIVKRGGTWVLLCFACRHQFRVSRRFGLEREIDSLFYICNLCK